LVFILTMILYFFRTICIFTGLLLKYHSFLTQNTVFVETDDNIIFLIEKRGITGDD